MTRAVVVDRRPLETFNETNGRYLRVLRADISWWRENASVCPHPGLKALALLIAQRQEVVLDEWKRSVKP
jgi:hypothetical protein